MTVSLCLSSYYTVILFWWLLVLISCSLAVKRATALLEFYQPQLASVKRLKMAFIKQEDEDTWLKDNVEIKDHKSDFTLIKDEVKAESVETKMELEKTINQDEDLTGAATKQGTNSNHENYDQSVPRLNKKGTKRSNRKIWMEIVENAPLSDKLENLCRYKCPVCGRQYETKNGLVRHFMITKHSVGPRGHLTDCITQVVAHKCSLCSAKILCEKWQILFHLRCHQIKTLEQYKDITKSNMAKEAEEEEQTQKLTWVEKFEQAPVSEEIGNFCLFKCPKCNKNFGTQASLKNHFVKTKHSLLPREVYTNYVTKIVVHRCSICLQKILCENCVILSHMKKQHKLKTLQEYIDLVKSNKDKQFWKSTILLNKDTKSKILRSKKINSSGIISNSVGNSCLYKCKECGNIMESIGGLKEHLRRFHKINAPGNLAYESLIKTVVHKCLVCSEKIICDKLLLKQHMERHKKLSLEQYMDVYNVNETFQQKPKRKLQDWLKEFSEQQLTNYKISLAVDNLCKYLCDVCNFTCGWWPKLRKHILANHSTRTKPSAPSQHITKVNFFKCKICSEILLCDNYFINKHLRYEHNEKIGTYKKKVKVPVGKNLKKEYLLELDAAISDIPKVPAKSNYVLKSGSLADNLLTGDVGYLSLFQCLTCHELLLSYSALHGHRQLYKHKPNGIHSRSDSIVVARYHKCHVCSKIILCDNDLIKKHTGSHDITYATYITEFVLSKGCRVIPSCRDYMTDRSCFHALTESVNNRQMK